MIFPETSPILTLNNSFFPSQPELEGKSIIEFRNVFFRVGKKEILNDINLTLKFGDFLTVIGPNGAGKSTLMKLMMGILKPSSGKIISQKKFRRSYVPQKFNVPSILPITVQKFLHLRTEIAEKEVAEILSFLGIDSLRNTFIHTLSGGETQKVLLARALLLKPDVVFLDEPAQSLDVNGQFQLYDLIRKTHEKYRMTIVLISHELHFVMKCSKYVICLYKHICCSGSPIEIKEDENYRKIFGKRMDKLMTVYSHKHTHSH